MQLSEPGTKHVARLAEVQPTQKLISDYKTKEKRANGKQYNALCAYKCLTHNVAYKSNPNSMVRGQIACPECQALAQIANPDAVYIMKLPHHPLNTDTHLVVKIGITSKDTPLKRAKQLFAALGTKVVPHAFKTVGIINARPLEKQLLDMGTVICDLTGNGSKEVRLVHASLLKTMTTTIKRTTHAV